MTEPDWKQIVMDKYDALGVGHQNHRARTSIMVNLMQHNRALMVEAARQRDMSMSAYVRRSALAVASYDLGIPWGEVTADERPFRSFGELMIGGVFKGGEGHGPWIINQMGIYTRE